MLFSQQCLSYTDDTQNVNTKTSPQNLCSKKNQLYRAQKAFINDTYVNSGLKNKITLSSRKESKSPLGLAEIPKAQP